MTAPSARHETRALLRAHLAAVSGRRHLTRHCPVCHRLLRLAMESTGGGRAPWRAAEAPPGPATAPAEAPTDSQTSRAAPGGPREAVSALHGPWEEGEGESPPNE
ncbi:DUF6274 family protein [Streptomyces sp. NPDC007088]|uniref:DUF6274 family protein n=1 Tax=Streptomyces sp. NPDC007088 TaxID=3364773 RepID=UPI0036C5CD1E